MKPAGHRAEVGLGWAEARREFIRRQPSMVLRRIPVLLIGQQFVKRRAIAQREINPEIEWLVGQALAG